MNQSSEAGIICFQYAPCGVLVMDQERSILQINAALESMLALPAERLVGKSEQNLKPHAYRALLKAEGLLHLAGPEIEQEKWFLCNEHRGPEQIVRFYLELTEQVRMEQEIKALREQVKDLTITDKLTGLANPRALNRALSAQVTRSRRYNNPLCLAVMELVDADQPEASVSDDAILSTSRHLRDRLRWVDTIARWDHNHFVVILPETNVEQGNDLLEKICNELTDSSAMTDHPSNALHLSFGLVQWQKGNDSRILMERAAEALNANNRKQGTQLETAVT